MEQIKKRKNTCVIPGHEGWLINKINRNPTDFANKVTGNMYPYRYTIFSIPQGIVYHQILKLKCHPRMKKE